MLLSIAIVNYNSGKYLGQAIESVIGQLDEKLVSEVELIVVDGGSTDDSISIIKKYEDKLGWWISEPDKGQSDAFNKAFSHARGKYLTWVNADDLMIKGSIREIVKNLKKYPKTRWFTANFLRFFNTGEVMEVNWGPHYLPRILQRPNAPVVSFGPSTIFEKKLLEELGWLDINLHFIMDLELWLRFMRNGVVQRRINCYCWGFRMHKQSKTASFDGYDGSLECNQKIQKEREMVRLRYSYKMSKVIRGFSIFLRLLDGSFLWKIILNRRYLGKNIHEVLP